MASPNLSWVHGYTQTTVPTVFSLSSKTLLLTMASLAMFEGITARRILELWNTWRGGGDLVVVHIFECLWYGVTRSFGGKWKSFFLELEHSYGLDPDRLQHQWLVHHLFLHSINEDAQEWVESWNAHHFHIRGEPQASPCELFMFGMVSHGPCGLQVIPPQDGQCTGPW